MKWFYPLILTLATLLYSCSGSDNTPASLSLNGNWEFKSTDDSIWRKASVPGCVHLDLIENKIIEDPFYRLNEHNVQWIDKKNWEYKTAFKASAEIRNATELIMLFEGLDTYAEVYLNDEKILESDNMFRTYEIDLSGKLLATNKLHILFESPINIGLNKFEKLDYEIPVGDNDLAEIGKVEGNKKVGIFTRKPGYHFGWDWGPRLVTSGIWKPVHIIASTHSRIKGFHISEENISNNNVKFNLDLDINAINSENSTIQVFADTILLSESNAYIEKGSNTIRIPIDFKKVEYWWPNGMGNQKLYGFTICLKNGKSVSDEFQFKHGFKTFQLVQEKDSIGRSFEFMVNDIPTYSKGVNYIPQDVFLPRVKASDYRRILEAAKDANMNTIRVWGGGIYENDIFYELCDSLGLLVWQDFMFACAMFPGDGDFLENVRQEAIDNVKRIRHHTCIALWCGNNENRDAWSYWGWENKTKEEQGQNVADSVWKAYVTLFHQVLPDVVSQFDPQRPYWPSSPGQSFGEPSDWHSGDYHYWGVWWGKEPFEAYQEKIPRFMSEFGFQSFPQFSSVKKYTIAEDHDVYSEVMKSHQRSSIGNVTIEEYMLRDYKTPKDFEHFLYVGQLLQAKGIKMAIEAHRRNRDRCMGSLYWQLNDCWPVASWSGIDYYGNWKAMHYAVREAFKNVALSCYQKDNKLEIHLVNDSLQNLSGVLIVEILDFSGKRICHREKVINAKENSASRFLELDLFSITEGRRLSELFAHIEFRSIEQKIIAENIHYFVAPKHLALKQLKLITSLNQTSPNSIQLDISSDLLAKSVFIESEFNGHFSKNYFDVLPGKTVNVNFTSAKKINIDDFKKGLKLISLVDSY